MTTRRTFCRKTLSALAAALLLTTVSASGGDEEDRMPVTLVVPEDVSPGTAIGSAGRPGSQAKGYRIVGDDVRGLFTIDGDSGIIRTGPGAEFDYESHREFVLTVTAAEPHLSEEPLFDDFKKSLMEAAVQATRIDKLTRHEVTVSIVVRLQDVPEEPVMSDQTLAVCEGAVDGTPVGNIVATDADGDESLRFVIVAGNHHGVFDLDPVTGTLHVVKSAWLDHEARNQHELRVRVEDASALTTEATVIVQVTDVNEPPVLHFERPDELTGDNTGSIGIAVATDPEGRGPVVFSIDEEALDAGVEIDPFTGMLFLTGGVGSSDELSKLSNVQICATDADGITASTDIAVDLAVLLESSLQDLPDVMPDALAVQRDSPGGAAAAPAAAARDSGIPRQTAFVLIFLAGLIAATTFAVIRIRSARDPEISAGSGYSRKLTLSEAVRQSVYAARKEKVMQFPSEESQNSSAVADAPRIKRLNTVAAGAGIESSGVQTKDIATDPAPSTSTDQSAASAEALRLRQELSELFGTPFDPHSDSSFSNDEHDNSFGTSPEPATSLSEAEPDDFGASHAMPACEEAADDEHRSFVDDYMSRLVSRARNSAAATEESAISVADADRGKLPVLATGSRHSDARSRVVADERENETQDSAALQSPPTSEFVCAAAPFRVSRPNIDRDKLRHSMVSFRAVAAQSIEQAIASHGRLAAKRCLSGRKRLLLALVIMLGLTAGTTALQVIDLRLLSAGLLLAITASAGEFAWRMCLIRRRPPVFRMDPTVNPSATADAAADGT